jgi:hypothetical protein
MEMTQSQQVQAQDRTLSYPSSSRRTRDMLPAIDPNDFAIDPTRFIL